MKDVIFTSYCFENKAANGDYKIQQDRLKESILKIYPEANLHFQSEPEETGKPKFQQSLYGFKVRLVKECLAKGFKKIVFFDAAITLNTEISHWWDVLPKYGVLAPIDRQKLSACTSDKCMNAMGLNRDILSGWNLVGGSIYVFDFDLELCRNIFDKWQEMEANGLFGSQEDCTNGTTQNHRMDETCMSIAMHLYNSTPVGYDIIKYGYEHPETKLLQMYGDYVPIAIKKHFK